MSKNYLIAIALVLAGCVTPSTMLVNPEGRIIRCASYGYGYGIMGAIAMSNAEQIHDTCVRDARMIGFIPIPMASLGIHTDPKSRPIHITQVSQNAESAGVKPGDILLEIDSRPMDNMFTVLKAMSSKKRGDRVPVKVQRGEEVLQFSIVASSRDEQ